MGRGADKSRSLSGSGLASGLRCDNLGQETDATAQLARGDTRVTKHDPGPRPTLVEEWRHRSQDKPSRRGFAGKREIAPSPGQPSDDVHPGTRGSDVKQPIELPPER